MSTPRSAASPRPNADTASFADDVAYYLSLTPRQLPSRYLYDGLGSALFDAICRLPWYRITRSEQQLLAAHSADIVERVAPLDEVVELGPGGGEKLATLLAATRSSRPLTVQLIDVSKAALDASVRTLGTYSHIQITAHQTTYESGLDQLPLRPAAAGRRLVLFLGSNIGNFDPPGANAFLRAIRMALREGDALLLGADLVKRERDLILAYDDPLGVTAAFNLNLLVRANRELGATFDIGGFDHRAVWNAEASRVEMHLVSRRRQRVIVPSSHLEIMFEAGETIWTESSYKYHPSAIGAMLEGAGFHVTQQWCSDGFALTLGQAS